MINDITFGQYFVANSFIHKLDPRIKLILMTLIIVLIFIATNIFSLSLITFFVFSIILISKIPVKLYFKNVKVIIPIIVLTSLLNLLYVDTGTLLLEVWKIKVYSGGLLRSAFMAIRVLLLILSSSVLTYTTTPNDLTDAIERLLKPLKFIGLGEAVHTMSMMMTIALRFIPTLIEETDKIMSAQKARGADLDSGGIIKKIKGLIPILIPLLISAIRRAYELAEAMECRCYNGGKNRQRMKQLKITSRDILAFSISVICLCAVIMLNIFTSIGAV